MKSLPTYSKPIIVVLLLLTVSVWLTPVIAAESAAKDWETPRGIVQALHELVSAEAGETRDWDRFRELFLEGAMVSMAVRSPRAPGIIVATPEELIQQTESNYASTGFHEIPLVYQVEEFGAMALVSNSFEVKLRRDDAAPLMRGLNHFQLLHDGERWWIVSNISTVETGDWKLPPAFVPESNAEISE